MILKKIVLPLDSILGTPSTKYFFALIKKIFLKVLIEISFRYQTFFKSSGTPYEQNEKFTYEVLGIKIG